MLIIDFVDEGAPRAGTPTQVVVDAQELQSILAGKTDPQVQATTCVRFAAALGRKMQHQLSASGLQPVSTNP